MALLIRKDQYFTDGFPLAVIKNSQHAKTALHRHEFYELVYIDHGVTLHSHEGQVQILTAGDLFMVLPGELHAYISTHNTGLYNCLFTSQALLGFEKDLACLPELGWLLKKRPKESFVKVNAGMAQRQQIALILEQVSWEKANQPLGWAIKCKILLLDLLLLYARLWGSQKQKSEETGTKFRQVLQAVAYIEANYKKEIAVDDIAAAAGLSTGYLSRQFKQFLGTSPADYARNFRMAKAAELLRKDEYSIADIARQLGFNDATLFSRQFRQVTGISPTGFRKNI